MEGGKECIGLHENKDGLNSLLQAEMKSIGFQWSLLLRALC